MKKILKWNPEFAKNLWIEFTPLRLIVLPAILFIVVVLVYMNGDPQIKAWENVHLAATIGFVFVGMLWGIKTASDAILDEYNERTWDWQKMSSIGPWKLAFGKLFGSTIYNWYGAIWCMLVYFVSAAFIENTQMELKKGILLIISMISLHGLLILTALQIVRKSDGRKKIKSNRIFIIGIFLLGIVSNVFTMVQGFSKWHGDVSWYGIKMDYWYISLITAIFYCSWIIAGLYRAMRSELQFSDTPVWWTAFIFSNFFMQMGNFVGGNTFTIGAGITVALASTFIQLVVMIYFMALSESKDVVNFRFLLKSLKLRNYKLFFQNVPLWIYSIPYMIIFGLLTIIIFLSIPLNDKVADFLKMIKVEQNIQMLYIFIAIICFIIRDLGVLLLLNFSPKSKRADSAMIIYLLLMYSFLPIFTRNFGISVLFYPNIVSGSLPLLIIPATEAAIIIFFLVRRWVEIEESNPV